MLLFSTILNLTDKLTKEDFVRLIIDWNQNSPHTVNVIPDLHWNGEMNIKFGDETRFLEINEYRNKNIVAIRFQTVEEDGLVWHTDFVTNFDEMRMAIQLDRSYREDAVSLSTDYLAPQFIMLLIKNGYLQPDRDLRISHLPHYIDEHNMYFVANLINKNKRYSLPVVYVSKTIDDGDPFDVCELAWKLKGVAHVFVQRSRSFGGTLSKICRKRNAFNGAVDIFFPNAAIQPGRYFYFARDGQDDEKLAKKVFKTVMRFAAAQEIPTLYTYDGVASALLTDRYLSNRAEKYDAEQAKKEAEDEKDSVYLAFDSAFDEYEKRIDELSKANEALRYENQGLRNKLMENDSEPVLFVGDEPEFYPGEIKGLLLSILKKELDSEAYSDTRKGHILQDIYDSNHTPGEPVRRRQEKLKQMLKTYDGMTKVLKQSLQDMGFTITDDGKHYKLVYYGDERYVFTLACTPSETKRGGKNAAADIIKKAL